MDFTSTIEDIDSVHKKISIVISADEVSREVNKAMQEVARSATVKGFRPGKVPANVIEKLYGDRVRHDVGHQLIDKSLTEVAQKQNIHIIGRPKLHGSHHAQPGSTMEFQADVAIYPQPEVAAVDALELSVPKREVLDSEIERVIDYLRKSRATLTPIEGRTTLAKGDVGQADFVVTVEGGEDSKPEPYSFCLGENQLPAEVEAALEGMSVGETRSATVTPPPGRENAEGKPICYQATLRAIFERVLPDLDDAFAKTLDPQVATVLELKLKVRESLQREKDDEHVSDVNGAIIEQLVDRNEFEIPDELVDDEMRSILVNRGFIDPKKTDIHSLPMDMFRKDLGDAARRRVKAAIVIDRLAEKEGIKLEKEDLEGAIAHYSASQNIGIDEARRRLFSDRGGASSLIVETLRNKVLSILRSRAKISFVSAEGAAGGQSAEAAAS